MSPLRVALGEYDVGWQDPPTSVERATVLIAQAASAGARLVVLPETSLSGFTMDPSAFAESLDGVHLRELARAAETADVDVLAGIARRDDADSSRFYNSVVHLTARAAPRVVYDKRKLFAYGGEHAAYAAGRADPTIVEIEGARLATFVCYDLRFPELFRPVAARVDVIVVVANWPAARRPHWDTLLRARAIENQCWVVGVNRTGTGGPLVFDGGSAAFDPWGERSDVPHEALRVVDIDTERVAEVREKYPFLRDAEV